MPTSLSTSGSEMEGSRNGRSRRRRFAAICQGAPTIRWTAMILCTAELIIVLVAPLAVPDSFYLRSYLGGASRRSMRDLLTNAPSYLIWDELTGWRNRPEAERGRWQVDANGARTTRSGRERADVDQVWFFGDSTVNGGTGLSSEETISAFLEDDRIATTNFGTMLFGLDQSLLLMQRKLETAVPKAIVIGLSENGIFALGNRYVPFRSRRESAMPYLKPRFVLDGSALVLLPTPPQSAYADLLGQGRLLRDLSASDEYYSEFSAYRHFGLLPISGALWDGYRKGRATWSAATGRALASPLLYRVLNELQRDARSRGSAVVILVLPTRAIVDPSRLKRLLPDRHGALVRGLREAGFVVIDGRDALAGSGRPAHELYHADGVHYTRDGNRIIAASLSPVVHTLIQDLPTNP